MKILTLSVLMSSVLAFANPDVSQPKQEPTSAQIAKKNPKDHTNRIRLIVRCDTISEDINAYNDIGSRLDNRINEAIQSLENGGWEVSDIQLTNIEQTAVPRNYNPSFSEDGMIAATVCAKIYYR